MTPYYRDDLIQLFHGDCLEVMASLPAESVDAIVTDPPYGLGFMGKKWDDLPPGLDFAVEAMRVLKPGGHLLAFGGTRTWHRLAVAVEDAGFEIRDSIAWLYGSGFPKSLDVSKAIDRAGGDTGQRVFRTELKGAIEASGLTFADIDRALGVKSTSCYWVREDHRACLPAPHHWAALGDLLPLSDDLRALYVECERADRLVSEAGSNEVYSPSVRVLNAGTPASGAAERWQGWGTALKPAFEPIVVARKPLTGTVAANVLEHGTGALNIDACRVGTSGGGNACPGGELCKCITDGVSYSPTKHPVRREGEFGRWPANVLLDDTQAAELDRQSGESVSSTGVRDPNGTMGYHGGARGLPGVVSGHADSGGASQFFKVISEHAASTPDFPTFRYQAKAPTRERPFYTAEDGSRVAHPTTKPLDLMRWLVRLVTPPGGTVLDPFAGSGTTGEACLLEHLNCILIEREDDYLPLIVQRVTKPLAVGLDLWGGGAS